MSRIIKKLNEKGLSIVEILVCFVIVAVVAIALLNTLMEYKTEEQIETIKSHVESYKNTVTRVIQTDITDNAIVGYSGKVLTHNDDEYKLEITLVYQKPFDNGSTTKLLTIYRNDEESYIMYPDIVKDDLGNYVAHDVKYKLEETSKVLDEEENKEFNDLNFPYITENMVRVKDGNTLTIDIPITHNELGTSYHIKIVAPLQLISAKNQAPPTTCSITYNHGTGATACDPQKKIVGVGEQWGELCTTTKPGYSLKSWKTADNCGGTEIYPEEECGTNINHYTVIAYPCWEARAYILTLVPQGNYSGATTRTMQFGKSNNNNVGADSKPGYKFKGWYTAATGGTQVYNSEGKNVKATEYWTAAYSTGNWKYAGDVTLYAQFSLNQSSVTLNPNGGTYNGKTTTTTKQMAYGSTNNNDVGVPTREGYKFKGWYTAKSGGTQVYNAEGKNVNASAYWTAAYSTGTWKYDGDVTLYAQWTAYKLKIKYHMNSGVWKGTNTDYSYSGSYVTYKGNTVVNTYNYGTDFDLSNYNNQDYIYIKRDGYHGVSGAEWNTKADGTGTSYNQATKYKATDFCSNIKNQDCEVTLYVNWTKNQVFIQYKYNGAALATTHGSTVTLDTSGYILVNNNRTLQKINYGESLNKDGLVNIQNPNYVNLTYSLHTFNNDTAWECISDECKGQKFDQSTSYAASSFCNAKDGNCTATLKVNWRYTRFTLEYHANGGVLKAKHGSGLTINSNGYIASGSSILTHSYNSDFANINIPDYNYESYINLYKTGYIVPKTKEWKAIKNGSWAFFNQSTKYKATDFCPDLTTRDCTTILYVNWIEVPTSMCPNGDKVGAAYFGTSQTVKDETTAKTLTDSNPSGNVGGQIDTSSWGKWCMKGFSGSPVAKNVGYSRICYTDACKGYKGMTAKQINELTGCSFYKAWCY